MVTVYSFALHDRSHLSACFTKLAQSAGVSEKSGCFFCCCCFFCFVLDELVLWNAMSALVLVKRIPITTFCFTHANIFQCKTHSVL